MSTGRFALTLVSFVLLCSGVQASTCGSSDPCPANRPRDPRGCCPSLGGERCGYDQEEGEPPGLVCDTELGYSCVKDSNTDTQGTCQGPYSVRVSNVQLRSATLEWDDFSTDDYVHEYSLLWTTDTYKPNISLWRDAEIGQDPRYELPFLTPATWYFMRVGVWADITTNVYANLTETVAFRTKSVAFCENDGTEYSVGQTFDVDCEDRCTCMDDGRFACVPQCDIPELPDERRCELERYNESSCCALRIVCEPIMANCFDPISEVEAEHGEEFETECSVCVCNNGTLSCDYTQACDRPDSSTCPNPRQVPVPGECCPQWRCGNSTCKDEGETYNVEDTWLKRSTCQSCTCNADGVTCEDLCEEPIRPDNCTRPSLTKMEGSCCDVIECLPPENECYYESQAYSQGSYLTNTKCELCVCADNSTVMCTPKRCPTVTVPKPSIFCPYPHIRKDSTDGCCDTLWCENPNQELVDVIKNLFGTSYSPHSVTLSFTEDEEEGGEEEEGAAVEGGEEATNTKYELHYSSNTNVSDNDTSTWQKETFTPKRVHSEDEPVTSPTHLLQTTGAIRVGKRVYVTVSAMEANTTYYLKVVVIKSGFHDSQTGEVTSQYAGVIAVRTLAEDPEDTCPTTCRSEEVLVIASPSCPKPLLITSQDCCPLWKCFPEDGGCHYKNLLLRHGEQVREHCERNCVCLHGNVTCTPVCTHPGEMPRVGCQLELLNNHCCHVWVCPPRSKPSVTMTVVISVEYQGQCTDGESFSEQFKDSVLDFVNNQAACKLGDGKVREECDNANISVTCPSKHVYRRRRDVDKIRVDIYITSNIRDSDIVSGELGLLASTLANIFNTSHSNITLHGTVYMRVGAVLVTSPIGNCDPGFIFDNNKCVEGITPSTPPTTLDVPINVSSTSTSALLAWKSLRTPRTRYVTGLQIQYQEEDLSTWNQSYQTDFLDPGVTSHNLTSLQAARRYRARLVVFTNIRDYMKHPLEPVRFETKPLQRIAITINIEFQEVNVSVNSVNLKWRRLNTDISSEVMEMFLRYTHSGVHSLLDPRAGGSVKTRTLTSSAESTTLTDLQAATPYVAHMVILLKNNTVARTGTIHFVTMQTGFGIGNGSDVSLVVALVVSAVVVFCAVAIVIITCFLWRRSRQKEAGETAFENKTFGLQLHMENDGRTLSARP